MAFAFRKNPTGAGRTSASGWDFRSPGLDLLTDRLTAPGRHEVLDLGQARAANVEFFNQFACRLHIEDVYEGLVNFPQDDPHGNQDEIEAARSAALDQALGSDPSIQVDLVLGWDLFSYLSPAATAGLMTRVATRCRPGTLLFLLVSTNTTMPAHPSKVTFGNERRIHVESVTTETMPCPGYPPLSLERMMPGFGLLHSFLLGERMQDYLFSFR